MGSVKYTILPTEAVYPDQKPSIVSRVVKVFTACLLVITIISYKWSAAVTLVHDQTIIKSKWGTSPKASPTEADKPVIVAFDRLENYFVFTSKCQMLSINPFEKDVLKIFKKTSYGDCDSSKEMISLIYDEQVRRYKLHINYGNVTCCYKPVIRFGSGAKADGKYKLLQCVQITQDFVVPQNLSGIITECRALQDLKILQKDAFTLVQFNIKEVNNSVTNVVSKQKSTKRRPSVLLWGIDSLSRMNFQRTMPLMNKYFRENYWLELQGYNKMGDNTYPNLMAILTGYNSSQSMSVCRPRSVGGLDACPILWKTYKKFGYITAYAEDWQTASTFNYNKKGFLKPPTDYYARPFMLAIEKELKKKTRNGIPYCVGRRHYAEYVYDSALQLTKVYRNQSSFGMFWTNSFSHNNFALSSSMDSKLLKYMHALNRTGAFDNSIILFFSDHGMRFGPLRKLHSGFLEERMPILHIWLPHWFREEHPQFVHNLEINRNRLTSPYDIYATLNHILELEKPLNKLPRPEGCPSCHSIFYEVAESRDCQDAGIDEHWCTCSELKEYNPSNTDTTQKVANQLIDATNEFLSANNLTKICQTLKLSKCESVQRKFNTESNIIESFLVRYEAEPERALFEATVSWNKTSKKITVNVPDISRLDSYGKVSECVDNSIAKKFCICSK